MQSVTRRCTPSLLLLGLFLVAFGWVSDSSAYCRQRTCQDKPKQTACQRDSNGCTTEGRELSYDTPCLAFAIAAGTGAAVGLSDVQFEGLVLDAFSKWADVDCGDGPPGFLVQSSGVVEASEPSYCDVEPRQNVNVFFFISEWPLEDENALGFTTVSFLPGAAAIVDADVKLNADYVRQQRPAEREEVVRAVILHEVGHFLGLGHSNDAHSVMAAEYDPARFLLPDLTTDDVNGICAVFPPSKTPAVCPDPPLNDAALEAEQCRPGQAKAGIEGCSLTDPGRSSQLNAGPREVPWLWCWAASALGLLSFARGARRRAARSSLRRHRG